MRLFLSRVALEEYLASLDFEQPVDGITLVQRYIQAPEPYITRLEFVGGRFLYAVRVDTSQGFELCPGMPVRSTPRPLDRLVSGRRSLGEVPRGRRLPESLDPDL